MGNFFFKQAFPKPWPSYSASDKRILNIGVAKSACMALLVDKVEGKRGKNLVIVFHGNGEDAGCSEYQYEDLMTRLDASLLTAEYPTYGAYKSTSLSQNRIQEDSLAVYDYAHSELGYEAENIFVLGRSIGSGPATYLASKRQCAGLFLVSGFTSLNRVVYGIVDRSLASARDYCGKNPIIWILQVIVMLLYCCFWILRGIFSLFLSEFFDNISLIKKISCPLVVIHGSQDSLIPPEHSEMLYKHCKKDTRRHLVIQEGMDHNKIDFSEDIAKPIESFVNGKHSKSFQ